MMVFFVVHFGEEREEVKGRKEESERRERRVIEGEWSASCMEFFSPEIPAKVSFHHGDLG